MVPGIAGDADFRITSGPPLRNTLASMRVSLHDGEFSPGRECISPVTSLLQSRIADLVSLPSTTAPYSRFRELVFAFEADWKALAGCRSDWTRLLETVVQINSGTNGDHVESAEIGAQHVERGWRSELLAGLAWPLSIRSQLEARLAPLPVAESQRILADNISRTVEAMAEHMTQQLDALVERCVLGEIEWYGAGACQYTFVDRSLHAATQTTDFVGPFRIDHERRVARRTFETRGTATKTVSVHVHDLVDAVCSAIEHATTEIPNHVCQVIERVPQFLRGQVKIVEGNLIRERCIEHDQGVEEWAVAEDVTVRYQFDPVIVLADRYVLIGWLGQPNAEAALRTNSSSAILRTAIGRLFQ